MDKINWVVTLIVSLILSLPVGVLANLWTPRIQDWLVKRALSSRSKVISRLTYEYSRVKNLQANRSNLLLKIATVFLVTMIAFFSTLLFIAYLCVLIYLHVSPSYGNLLIKFPFYSRVELIVILVLFICSLIINYIVLIWITELAQDIIRLRQFKSYEKRILDRIAKLEVGNLAK